MALWSKKKVGTKIINYLKEKNISYQIDEQSSTIIKFELCFTDSGFILYPYISVDEINSLVTFNVNVSQINVKNNGYDYEKKGLLKRIMSSSIVNTNNAALRTMLDFYEASLIFVMKYIDILKNFKNPCWKNR